jgi:hypothetical protein
VSAEEDDMEAKRPGPVAVSTAAAVAATPSRDVIHLPRPSVWPAVAGLGITLLGFGVLTSLLFSLAGGLALAGALAGWIGELRHE